MAPVLLIETKGVSYLVFGTLKTKLLLNFTELANLSSGYRIQGLELKSATHLTPPSHQFY